ncbi:hypothetical protein [Paenibacillus abyssi]|uniref:Transposase n=1 Tax=Paenibacillus abyssi TaxID=1340531 RepID=A0A917G253_9BACL|nr:hypothetical protein [Paenibacillus abyssi]GGG18043.1 hypothetical protein GCM10010916_38550 [Paenibacillus abyssi]
MIPSLERVEQASQEAKHELLALALSEHDIGEICKTWGVSTGTYYNFVKKWEISLSDVRRRKRQLHTASQDQSVPSGTEDIERLMLHFEEVLNSDQLSQLLQSIKERIQMSNGTYRLEIEIEKI